MKFRSTELPGVMLVEPTVRRDSRGFFLEVYHQVRFREGGIQVTFVQDNHSRSEQGVLRGLHAQLGRPQGKLVRVIAGEVFDVAVDIRRGSPTFGRWIGHVLSAGNFLQCYVPPGFAHGFCVTSEAAEVEYKCSDLYDPADEITILWSDPDIGVRWPVSAPILSEKDARASRLRDVIDRLPRMSR